jgi:hypothetical protein
MIPVLLMAMLGGHITELFDRWDHTLQTGTDVDYTVVIIAACVGVVFAVAKILIALFRYSPRQEDSPEEQSFSFFPAMFPEISVAGPSPPLPLPLRI